MSMNLNTIICDQWAQVMFYSFRDITQLHCYKLISSNQNHVQQNINIAHIGGLHVGHIGS